MKHILAVGIVVLTVGMIACGNTPTGPEEELVGTWGYEDSDMIEVLSERFEDYLVGQGVSQPQARAIADSLIADSEQDIGNLRLMVHLNADNSWEDNRGEGGTWRVDGNELVFTYEDGDIERVRYFLGGDDLTLIFTKAWLLEALAQDENFDAEAFALFNDVLREDDVFRFFFGRR